MKTLVIGWGDAVVENLSIDLTKSFPGSISFPARNLWLMRQLYTGYRDLVKKTEAACFRITLRGISKPVGVAEYQLTSVLPEKLKGKLPDPAHLKKKLMKEFNKK